MTDIHELIREADSERRTHLHVPGLVEYDQPIVLTRDSSIRRITGDGISEEKTIRTEPSVGLVYWGTGSAITLGEHISDTRDRGMIGVSVENLQLMLANQEAEYGIFADHCPHLSLRRVHLSGTGKMQHVTLCVLQHSYSSAFDDVTFCLATSGLEVYGSHWTTCRALNFASVVDGANVVQSDFCAIDGLQMQSVLNTGVTIFGCQHTTLRDVRCEWSSPFRSVYLHGVDRMTGWTTIDNANLSEVVTEGVVQKLSIRSSHIRKLVTDSHRAATHWERDRLSEIDEVEGRAPFDA